MILPVRAYGDPILRKKCVDITPDYPNLKQLVEDMFETMYSSSGVGIAAPQVGLGIRIFVVDASPFAEDEEDPEIKEALQNCKKVFINNKVVGIFV